MEQSNLIVTQFEQWKNFYDWGCCTISDLQMLMEYGVLTQEQVNEIIASKPNLTGRIVNPIPKGNSNNTTTTPVGNTGTATDGSTNTGGTNSTPNAEKQSETGTATSTGIQTNSIK